MGILNSIFKKIFPSAHAEPAATPANESAATTSAPAAPANAPMTQVDVEGVLNRMAEQSGEKLNWRTSIVDLLKLLQLDSGLSSRKELAKELNYAGELNGSAEMNIWLHRQVMNKLAANGGKVPPDLKD
jgi:hypothetical protein